jgi:PAS domain S-box-containing protein
MSIVKYLRATGEFLAEAPPAALRAPELLSPAVLRLRLRQQEILADFGVTALKGLPFRELLQQATQSAATGLGAQFAKVLEFLPDQNRFLVCAGVGWGDGVIGVATVGADTASPAGYALRTGKAVISNHLDIEERFRTPELLVQYGIRRAMNVILSGDGNPFGVLEVDSRSEGEFDDNDIVFLRGIANMLGMAIEHERIEASLRDSEQRLSWSAAIVESSDDAIVSKNLEGVISSWNPGAERIFGYTAAEAIGQTIMILIPPDRQDEERTILTRIRRGERIEHFETVRRRKNGTLITVSITVSPVKNARGIVVGASKIARDITEQKQAQQQIALLAREAEHRARNLLANVQATVKLSRGDTPDDLKEAIEGRIQALANVNSLFAASRWIGAEFTTIAEQELAPYLAKDAKRVRINGPQVLLEPNAAQSIAVALHELATNAAKYGALSSADGHVDLTWTHSVDGRLDVCWAESGGPTVQAPTRRGFGTLVIQQIVGQLKGELRFDWHPSGVVCDITLRL